MCKANCTMLQRSTQYRHDVSPGTCPAAFRWLLSAGLALLASAALAADGPTSAPVIGQLHLVPHDKLLANGSTFTVDLRLTASADVPRGQLSMRATQHCAQLAPGQPGHIDLALKRRQSISLQFRYRLLTSKTCSVIAEFIGLDAGTTRLTSLFSVTINPQAEAVAPVTTRGQTAEGRTTMEATADTH